MVEFSVKTTEMTLQMQLGNEKVYVIVEPDSYSAYSSNYSTTERLLFGLYARDLAELFRAIAHIQKMMNEAEEVQISLD